MLLSKLKEVWICLKSGRVTLPYPFKPALPPDGFRGKLEIDPDKCIGCAGCANVCTPRAIVVTDKNKEWRTIDFFLERCTYCGRCEEVCPEKAITMTKTFEMATDSKEDLHISVELYMGTCGRCGRCFLPEHGLDKLMVTGYREH
ncbi:4Fe-4S dicluster domain-containing protein [bacterium]